MAINAVILFCPVTPAINVVVANNIKLGEKLWRRERRIRCNPIAGYGDHARRIILVKYIQQTAQRF